MANLKEIRARISSVNSTKQITSAMKMVSAAKLRRAQDAITQMRPYAEKLQEILANVSSTLDGAEGVFSEEREAKRVLIVAITSNRGLCGGFNNNVIKQVRQLANNDFKGAQVTALSIGKKAHDAFKNEELGLGGTELPKHLETLYDDLSFDKVAPVAERLMDLFQQRSFDHIVLVYNRFKNAAVQVLTTEQFLPVLPPEGVEDDAASGDFIFEPSKEEIVEELIPNSLRTQLFKALLDSHAAEHGARMTAMHKATDNADELLKELRLTYNKARQAAITGEILEIVGGAEALNG